VIARAAPLIAVPLALLPAAAWAHAPVPGVGAFWNGVLHPLLVPLHLLALVGAGIAAPAAGAPPAALLAVGVATGLLAALGHGAVAVVATLAAAAGLAVGLDSAPLEAASGEAGLAAAGTLVGCLLVVVLAGGLAAAMAAPWQRIAVRTAGSWIAAACLIALALTVADPGPLS